MKPTETGFDGAKGINLNNPSMIDGGFHRLRRGTKRPDKTKYNYRNQLLWYMPENEEPKLLYCNENNNMFELEFKPIEL